uniref:CUB domain-containing protein n=1 Tax=Ciona savignyi TaxID=51511 RepID=H2YSJ2_CIOSA
MEPHRACSFDYLSVFDGPSTSSSLIGKYCGSEVPPSITGSGSYLTVYFHSDSSVQGDGFQFRYTVGCTYTFTDTQGTFTSPGYPSNYPQSSDCTYNIQPSSGNQILLSF